MYAQAQRAKTSNARMEKAYQSDMEAFKKKNIVKVHKDATQAQGLLEVNLYIINWKNTYPLM